MSGLVGIKPSDQVAPNTDDHGIAIEFPDDHSITGMKIRVLGLTAEQVAVAAFHINRVANQAADYKAYQATLQANAVALDENAIRQELARKS